MIKKLESSNSMNRNIITELNKFIKRSKLGFTAELEKEKEETAHFKALYEDSKKSWNESEAKIRAQK